MRRLKHLLILVLLLCGTGSIAYANQHTDTTTPSGLVGLAARYENGESVTRNFREAFLLYCQAAARDDGDALFHLGWMYLNGRGVPHSDPIAVALLRKAAAHGVEQAQNLVQLLSAVTPSTASPCAHPPAAAPLTTVAARPGVLPRAPAAIQTVVDEAAYRTGVNPHLLLSVIKVESGFNPNAVSPKSAAGLMQLMPATAVRFGVHDRFDPRDNVRGGATYLRSLLDMFRGNLTLALAAYNAGENAVLSRGGVPPYRETQNYVAAVKGLCGCGE